MASNKQFISMSVEIHKDWLSLVKSISDSLSPAGFLLEARAMVVKKILQDKEAESLFAITKEVESLEYVNCYYASEKIDATIKMTELAARFLPEELTILFLSNRVRFSSERFEMDLNNILYSNEDICCVLNIMFDENVMLISADHNKIDGVRRLLKDY